jgi:hypothetical protein
LSMWFAIWLVKDVKIFDVWWGFPYVITAVGIFIINHLAIKYKWD